MALYTGGNRTMRKMHMLLYDFNFFGVHVYIAYTSNLGGLSEAMMASKQPQWPQM